MTWYIVTFTIGFGCGLLFYSKLLDKPEVVQKIGKQKVKKGGFFKNIFKSKR